MCHIDDKKAMGETYKLMSFTAGMNKEPGTI